MSIAKLFVKVFGADIFDVNSQADCDDAESEQCLSDIVKADQTIGKISTSEQIVIARNWLEENLRTVENNCKDELYQLSMNKRFRCGPHECMLEVDFSATNRIASDRLTLRSLGSFNTVKSTVCVFGGRWMYEVQLHTKGVMQIGWCSHYCVFNENSGVGDTKYSYGYDGSKQKIWHISTCKYGDRWQVGDIVGVTIDIDEEKIEFFRNGHSMGVAFRHLNTGPNITFYPAFSLSYNQCISTNFGGVPFKYPVDGFSPLHEKPTVHLKQAELLLEYLKNLAVINAENHHKHKRSKGNKYSTKKWLHMVFCRMVMTKLGGSLMDPYIIEDKLVALFCKLATCNDFEKAEIYPPGTPETTLGALLSILWTYLDSNEIKFVLKKVSNSLLCKYTHTHVGLDYAKQRQAIYLLVCLCNHERTRKAYLDNKFFKKHCLPLFIYMKPPDYTFLEGFIPDSQAWTQGIGGPKQEYLKKVESLKKSTESLYALQKYLIILLMTNDDGDEKSPSSRKMFITKLRRYCMDISWENRPFHAIFLPHSSIQHPIESKISLSFLSLFVDVARKLCEKELADGFDQIPPRYFFDGTFEYEHFDRLGGVLSHLRKVHRAEIITQLGVERTQEIFDEERAAAQVDLDSSVYVTAVPLNSNISVVRSNQSPFRQFLNQRYTPVVEPTPGNISEEDSLYELCDIAVFYYYCTAHKYVVKIASVRNEIAALNDVMNDVKFYRETTLKTLVSFENAKVNMNEAHNPAISLSKMHHQMRNSVFGKRSVLLARKQAWYRAVPLNKSTNLNLIWLLERILSTLNAASAIGPLFSFLPEVYVNVLPILLDTVMDFSSHELLKQFDIIDAECAVNSSAEFLSLHSSDARIVLASCKDALLQALGALTCHKLGVKALEKTPKRCQEALIKSLLRPYESRAWGQSNWLLLRFWLGDGYAFRDSRQPSVWQGGHTNVNLGLCRSRAKSDTHTGLLHHIAPATSSKIFQKSIGQKLTIDEPFATTFLNSVLSQLNWAFSEFILLLQEIQNSANRQGTGILEPKQLKICSMCYELTVSLMRCLEFIISVAPAIVQDQSRQNSDLILNRICQLVSQVLSRVTVPPGCFQFVVDMCASDLNSVTHFPIITAALGILVALLRADLESNTTPAKVTRVTRALLTDASFQFANLEFALGEVRTPILQQTEIPRGNFDPQKRAHIDPLTNDVRVPVPSSSTKRIRVDPPLLKFILTDFPTHVTPEEIKLVRDLIDMLRSKQALLSDIMLPSEDSLCPICCAKPIAVVFAPCKHQSCANCILQHLMNSKVCFYCKTLINSIETTDGVNIYRNSELLLAPTVK